jgi:hypothetical protein
MSLQSLLYRTCEQQIPAQLIRAGSKTVRSEIHNSLQEELPEQLKESIIVPVYRKGDKTDNYHCYQLHRPTCT